MDQEHGPWDIHSFQSGSDTDTSKELLGATNNGKYVRMRNGRIRVPDGVNQAATKIGGETILYINNLPSSTYKCMVSCQINEYFVEVWADKNAVLDSLIRVDGVIVLQSPLFPVTVADPPQYSKNENTLGGEIGLTALSFTPLLFNIKDMVDSLLLDPNKYFSAFDTENFSVNLFVALDVPAFQEIVNVGGGGGLPVGDYSYSMRYSSDEGDRTNWSVETPLIPIIQNLSSASPQYPYAKTYGGPAAPQSNTRYGIKMRFRVTNLHNYQYIEIKRTAFNQNAAIGFTPTPIIIAKVPIAHEEISWRDFTDPVDSNIDPGIPISDAQLSQTLAFVVGAKTIRYIDRRLVLMNVILASKISELTFLELEGKKIHPVIDKIGKPGFSDPWNFVNRKSYMGGEKFSFAVVGFDGTFGQGFAQKDIDLENFQYPNRRDVTSSVTDIYSYGGTVRAATTDITVDSTHEVFDLTDAVAKTDVCSFKNIYQRGDLLVHGYKSTLTDNVNAYCDETLGEIANHGAYVPIFTLPSGLIPDVFPAYHPYSPTGTQDSDTSGHNYRVNPEVSPGGSHLSDAINNNPTGFAPNYYSHGMLLTGLDNFPDWMKSFSIVRSNGAGRVIAQGLGAYHLQPAIYNSAVTNTSLAGKVTDKVWFFCPDIENGIVSSDVVNDMTNNPQNYSVQFVSPLGFFSEIYNFETNSSAGFNRDGLIDMISYARIVRDVDGGQINPAEDLTMGYDGFDGYRYPGYGKWRNTTVPPLFSSSDKGNNVFQLQSAERITEGRGTYIGLQIQGTLYANQYTGGTFERNFDEAGLKDWTEPVYIINIVQTGAKVPDQNIQAYKNCHYQKLESIIGRGDGSSLQQFLLVDERWEDCISALDISHPTSSTDRFIYIRHPDGTTEKWWNITFYTVPQRSAINNTIIASGSYPTNGATGTYTSVYDGARHFTIVFDQALFYPGNLDFIIVKYDNTAPIKFFGGDSTVGETIFAPIDRESDAYDNAKETQFAFGVGFPYFEWCLNPRHYVITKTNAGFNRIQNQNWLDMAYIRQLCMMFCVESRAVMPYSFNLDYPLQYFPSVHYVMRPNRWDPTTDIVGNNIYQGYVDDYGEAEMSAWAWGGLRFRQNINHEYTNESANRYFSKPDYGFVEKLHYPTREMHSLPRSINVQDSPGLRTFPSNNSFDIDDNTGEIKYAYSEINERGENLYAITEKGICLLLTKKSILSDLNAGEIAYMATTAFVQGQYWIDRTNGMDDQMWRSVAEGNIPLTANAGGGQNKSAALFFANRDSVFMFSGNQLTDIAKANYMSELSPYLKAIRPGVLTHITGFYDQRNDEYWFHIYDPAHEGQDTNLTNLFVYSPDSSIQSWTSNYDYRFDRMSMAGLTKSYGSKQGETYLLNDGFVVNGTPVQFELTYASSPDPSIQKEFERVVVNGDKPTSIEFYDENDNLLCLMDQPTQGIYYLKKYSGWEQGIPRNISGNKNRVQERVLMCKVIHSEESKFIVHTSGMQVKKLK